jgi:hypothetical protein
VKLLTNFREQIDQMGELKYVWFTSFNLGLEFVETYLLPAVLGMEAPKNRMDYEQMQLALTEKEIDFRVFCDKRFMESGQNKRTAIPVHGISPAGIEYFSKDSLFHPKVIYLEDKKGKKIIGAGSANLTQSGWGRNQEVFQFFEVNTLEQYQSVKTFFITLFKNVGLECPLPIRRNFGDKSGCWSFVHSFHDETFLEKLFDGCKTDELLVWSPYLPKDLPTYVAKLKEATGRENLKIKLVPDRVEGKYIRTPWSDALQGMIKDGGITFYENPSSRPPNVELCHAKVWQLPGKLAIGSWNFTGPGSNSMQHDDGEWSEANNIEAGFIIKASYSWKEAVGNLIKLGQADFASDELLEKDSLEIPLELPFDIWVNFDWREMRYEFSGEWLEGNIEDSYSIKVPGVSEVIRLSWRPKKKDLQTDPRVVLDQVELLSEHRFEILKNKDVMYRGLVTETAFSFRRSQAYESLSDLLNAFVFNNDPGSGEPPPIRIPVDEGNEPIVEKPENEAVDDAQTLTAASSSIISYFRLFQAFARYTDKINAAKKVAELNQLVFSMPGCLAELSEKTIKQIKTTEPTIFNWFLVQEVNALCASAHKVRTLLGNNEDSVSKSRFDALFILVPSLPKDTNMSYAELIQRECKYVRT